MMLRAHRNDCSVTVTVHRLYKRHRCFLLLYLLFSAGATSDSIVMLERAHFTTNAVIKRKCHFKIKDKLSRTVYKWFKMFFSFCWWYLSAHAVGGGVVLCMQFRIFEEEKKKEIRKSIRSAVAASNVTNVYDTLFSHLSSLLIYLGTCGVPRRCTISN